MGEALIQEQTSAEARELAAADAIAWGFPRQVYTYEINTGAWYRLGPHCVFWYESGGDEDEFAVHIAVDPEYRYRWHARTFINSYADIARGIGAKSLWFIPCDGDTRVKSILLRLGWTPSGDELRMELV